MRAPRLTFPRSLRTVPNIRIETLTGHVAFKLRNCVKYAGRDGPAYVERLREMESRRKHWCADDHAHLVRVAFVREGVVFKRGL